MTDGVGTQPKRKTRTPEERKAALQAELAKIEAKEREKNQARLVAIDKQLASVNERLVKLTRQRDALLAEADALTVTAAEPQLEYGE